MQDLLNIFKALSEETRLRILKLLEKWRIMRMRYRCGPGHESA